MLPGRGCFKTVKCGHTPLRMAGTIRRGQMHDPPHLGHPAGRPPSLFDGHESEAEQNHGDFKLALADKVMPSCMAAMHGAGDAPAVARVGPRPARSQTREQSGKNIHLGSDGVGGMDEV